MGWKSIAIAGLPLVLAACGASAASSSAPSPVIIATLPPTALPTLNPAQHIGDGVQTTTNAVITVEKTAPASSANQFETPPAGDAFLAVELKECAGNQVLYVSPTSWSVLLADSTQIDAAFRSEMTPGPELSSTNLNPGACTDGWLYFALPANSQPKEIHLLKADFYWTL